MMASKKKLKQRIAVLEERLVSANDYNQAILKEANAHRDVIEDIVKAIVTNFFDDSYLDATIREVRAANEWDDARKSRVDYFVDHEKNRITFVRPPEPGETQGNEVPKPILCWRCDKPIDQDSKWHNLSTDKNIHPGHCEPCAIEMYEKARDILGKTNDTFLYQPYHEEQ